MRKQVVITTILMIAALSLITGQVVAAKTVHLKAGEKVVKVRHHHHHAKHHKATTVREVVVEKTVHKKHHRASSNNDEEFNSRDICNFVDSPRAAFEFGCF